MFSRVCKLFFVFLILAGGVDATQPDLSAWRFAREIKGAGSGKYQTFFLTEEVYRQTSPDLADLRITDKNGEFVPYYLQYGNTSETRKKELYDARLIKSFKKEGTSYLDYRVYPHRETEDILTDSLTFSLPEENFYKKIIAYGGYDNKNWEYLREDRLYQVEGLKNDTVTFSEVVKYNFYRIEVPKNSENLVFRGMKAVNNSLNRQEQSFRKTTGLRYRMRSGGEISTIIVENKDHLKISALHFQTEGNFQRRFEVLGREKDLTRLTGEIYNLQFQDFQISQTSIDFADDPVTLEEIRIKIINHDNPPIKILGITGDYLIDKIVFEDPGGGPYRLYYGNPSATKPHYDLEFYKMHLLKEKQDLCMLGEEREFSETKPESPGWHFDYLFSLVIIIISLALIVLLVMKLNFKTNRP